MTNEYGFLLRGTKVRLKHHTEISDWEDIPTNLKDNYLKVENTILTIKNANIIGHYEFCENVGFAADSDVFVVIDDLDNKSECSLEEFEAMFA